MMLRFQEVAVFEHLPKTSFSFPGGVLGKIITASDYSKNLILDLLLGLEKPEHGKVYLFNKDLAELSSQELYELRRRCGVVLSGGGLISNLKIRENLALPLLYHTALHPEEIENKLMNLLNLTGMAAAHSQDFDEYFGRLPGPLSLFEKRQIALARAMATDPDIMIYDSIFEGISSDAAKKILEITVNFHQQKEGRCSIYLSVHEDAVEPIKTDWIIRVAA